MNEHREGPADADDEALLRRWYAASSQSRPIPSDELLAGAKRADRGRRPLRNLAMAAIAIVGIVAGIAGAGAWLSFRAAPLPSGTPSLVPTGSTRPQSPGVSILGSSGPALADQEYIDQMHRTATGGWLLTGSRLLVTDGSSWRTCWTSSNGGVAAPYPIYFGAGDTIALIDGLTLWMSTDGCVSWTHSAAPIAYAAPFVATGIAFPTESTGYVVYAFLTDTNQRTQIYRTDDGGRHWMVTAGTVKAVAGPNGSVFDGNLTIAFADADHGWLTDTHTLWTTANGGDTWTRTTLPIPGSVHGRLDLITTPVVGADGSAVVVAKYDATPGMDGARGQRVFYRTVDRGAHWTAASVVTDPGMIEISLVDPTTWVVFNPNGPASFQMTSNAGSTWQTIAVRKLWPYNSGPIDFADSLHGWMVVSEPNPPCAAGVQCDYLSPPQHIVTTDDGGATWVELKP